MNQVVSLNWDTFLEAAFENLALAIVAACQVASLDAGTNEATVAR